MGNVMLQWPRECASLLPLKCTQRGQAGQAGLLRNVVRLDVEEERL